MPVYKNFTITDEVWNFFATEDGLSTDQLKQAIDEQNNQPRDIYSANFNSFGWYKNGFALVKFYRDQPGLEVEDLLIYHQQAISAFALSDNNFAFQRLLLNHNLTIPKHLTQDNPTLICHLINDSGIEYLNRKILSRAEPDQQNKLDELAELTLTELKGDKNILLADKLIKEKPDNNGAELDIEQRFRTFAKKSNKESATCSLKNLSSCLVWKSNKTIIQAVEQTNSSNMDYV